MLTVSQKEYKQLIEGLSAVQLHNKKRGQIHRMKRSKISRNRKNIAQKPRLQWISAGAPTQPPQQDRQQAGQPRHQQLPKQLPQLPQQKVLPPIAPVPP